MTTKYITNINDLPLTIGKKTTLTYPSGLTITGPVCNAENFNSFSEINFMKHDDPSDYVYAYIDPEEVSGEFLAISYEEPDLPTKPGSLIRATKFSDPYKAHEDILLIRQDTDNLFNWKSLDGAYIFSEKGILEFTIADLEKVAR